MMVGIFSPVINVCGGAEWVAVNIISALKVYGHKVTVLSDKPLNQNKFAHVFGNKVWADQQMVFPLRFFSPRNYHNIYTDTIRLAVLKSKCEVVIDTFSNAVLPGVGVSYIHHPLLKRVQNELPRTRNKVFFCPYRSYLNYCKDDTNRKLIFANSKFTAKFIKNEIGVNPSVLYPSVSNHILNHDESDLDKPRDNNVTTVARIANGKKLESIPYIAKLTSKDISFTIAGLLDSERVLYSLLRLIRELEVSDRVKILTNVKRDNLRNLLLSSKVYLHPMVNEHFGISIVEAMALGCVPVVHNSGGPREFVPKNQRFNNIDEAAEMVERAIDSWSPIQARKISKSAEMFGENNFSKQFMDIFHSHFKENL